LIRPGSRAVAHNILRSVAAMGGITLVSNPLPGHLGLLGFQDGELLAAIEFELHQEMISHIDVVRHPDRVASLRNELGLRATD
jgi:hypothetical protein